MSACFWGVGGLNQNADTADAGEGGGGEKLGLRAEIKRK